MLQKKTHNIKEKKEKNKKLKKSIDLLKTL